MAKKDIAAKVLEKNNDVFADILNVAFFKKDYVKPEELSEAPTEFYYWTQDKEGCRDLRRDVAKVLSKNGKPVAIICIENQSCIDKTMPFRVQEYDGATYLMQLKNSIELPLPVITIVLYFGKRKWRAPLIIKDAISKEHDIPEEISEHIPYYQMNLIEVAFLPEDVRKKFTSDFGIAADFLAETRVKARNYIPSKKKIVHLRDFLFFMEAVSKDSRFGTLIYNLAAEQEGAVSMCELLNLYWDEGKNEGRVNMLLSYLKNNPNTNPDDSEKTFKLLGATQKEIAKAKELFSLSQKEPSQCNNQSVK